MATASLNCLSLGLKILGTLLTSLLFSEHFIQYFRKSCYLCFPSILGTQPASQFSCFNVWASLVAQIVKNLCNVGDPGLISGFGRSQKGMATHSSNLVYRISWTVKPGGLQFMGSLYFMESDNWVTNIFITKIQIIFKSIKPRTIFEKKIQVLQIQGKWR